MVQDGIYYALEEVNKRLEAENRELRAQVLELKERVEKFEKERQAMKELANSTKPVTPKKRK